VAASATPERRTMGVVALIFEFSDFVVENATLKSDYLGLVVEILIGGFPTVLEGRFMSLLMSLGGRLLQGYILTNLFNQMRHHGDLQTVEVGIQLLEILSLVADIIPPGV
jgi:hypothetical protein